MKKTTAEWLKHYRKIKGYTLQEVAESVHLDASTISKYENGKRTPDPNTISSLAILYGVSTDDLMPGAHPTIRERVFFIPQPIVKPWPKISQILYVFCILAFLLHGLFGLITKTVNQTLLFTSIGVLVFFVAKRLYDLAFAKPIQTREYKLSEHEHLVFIHPDSEKTIRKTRVLDSLVYVVLLFCAFIVSAFYLQVDDGEVTIVIITLVMVVNLFALATLTVFALLGKTEPKRMAYLETNATLNTVKYRVLEVVTLTTSFLYFAIYPFAVERFEASLDVAVFLFLMNYSLIAVAFTSHKRHITKQYTIHTERL